MPDPNKFPPGREQTAIPHFIEPSVNQQHHAAIGFRTDNPPDSLENTVHAGKSVGVIKSRRVVLLEIIADQIPLDTKLRQSHADDNGPDQTLANQVDPFAENSTQHGKPDQGFAVLDGKAARKASRSDSVMPGR